MYSKIIVLYPHFLYLRGATKYTLETTERLAKNGVNCLVITTAINSMVIKNYPYMKFSFVGRLTTSNPLFWFSFPFFQIIFHQFLNSIPNKILLAHIFPSNHWALIYKKFHPEVPLIWVCHEPSAFIHSLPVIESLPWWARIFLKVTRPFLIKIDRWLVKSADFIIANSYFTAKKVREIYGRKVDAIAYPGVDFAKFRPRGEKENLIFTLSRLDKAKRIDILIHAFAKLPQNLKERLLLVIGGEGREKKNLQNLAKKLRVFEKVKFLGEISEENLPFWYSRAKVVVFPAVNEPFGIVPVEAMACGTPVLATKTGGVKEIIQEGINGLFFEANDINDLAEKLTFILKNKNKLAKLAANTRKTVREKFSWEKATAEIEKILMKAEAKITKTTRQF